MRDGPADGLPHVGEQSGDRFGNGHHHDWRRPSHTEEVAISLTLQAALALALQCAPTIDPYVIVAIGQHESGLDPLTIHDNTTGQSLHGEGAMVAAARLVAAGHSVDWGLMQIGSHILICSGCRCVTPFQRAGRSRQPLGYWRYSQNTIRDRRRRALSMATRHALWPSWIPLEASRRPL